MIVAGTGHRPKFCPCKYKNNHPWLNQLKENLRQKLISDQVSTIISGMAIGWDTWIAQVAIDMGLPVHAYVPFRDQGSQWPSDSLNEYKRILGASEKVIFISEEYSNEAFLKRDRAMVDNCDHVYSLLDPACTSGGTFYTVAYAKSKNIPVTNFWYT
jgi:uncharacterized phage-like protein YoqJ